jgi:hypothetical protein
MYCATSIDFGVPEFLAETRLYSFDLIGIFAKDTVLLTAISFIS